MTLNTCRTTYSTVYHSLYDQRSTHPTVVVVVPRTVRGSAAEQSLVPREMRSAMQWQWHVIDAWSKTQTRAACRSGGGSRTTLAS